MIDSSYRSRYQTMLVDPLIPHVLRWNPLHITILGLLSGLMVIPSLAFHHTLIALTFLLFSGYLDTLDGSLARAKSETTPKGAVIDIVSDRTVEFAIILGLFLVDPSHRGLSSLLMLGSAMLCVTTFLVVGIFTENDSHKSFHYSPGLIERAEAFILFGFMILFPCYFTWIATAFSVAVLFTALMRIWNFWRHY